MLEPQRHKAIIELNVAPKKPLINKSQNTKAKPTNLSFIQLTHLMSTEPGILSW